MITPLLYILSICIFVLALFLNFGGQIDSTTHFQMNVYGWLVIITAIGHEILDKLNETSRT